ncbi:unnamed protein product [Rotaria magnacalcarata]|uniref:DYW domain-containing protein n=7 Tax=Rotaria TaxID=231623 RepID=A0A8S2K8K1_9BILA|nr:unnamed protein product [Rotaria magnacalcarata]
MMSNILKNNYLRFVILAGRCLASTGNNVNIGDQMKILNDNKQYKKVLELFDAFNENNIDKCSNWIVIQALKACTQINDVQHGLKIHNLISSRLKHDPYVLPSLIHFYMQCGDINRAQLLFETSTKKTLPMYGAMMKGYIKNNLPKKVIDLFNEIKDPDRVIIILLFNACAQLGTNEELNLCGDVTSAKSLFDRSSKKTISMYGAMMKGFIINNSSKQAIDLFNEIKDPNEIIITLFFNACAQLGTGKELILLKSISSKISNSFYSDPYVVTSLIDAFMKCGDVTSAEASFDRSTKKTTPVYGAMMKGFIINNLSQQAIDLFNEIKDPNETIITLFFNACAQLGTEKELILLKSISSKISNSFYSNPYVVTSLIDAFMKCGDVTSAKALFDRSTKKALSMYGAMMKGLTINDQEEEAIGMFNEIHLDELHRENHSGKQKKLLSEMNTDRFEANIIVYLCLLKALTKLGMLEKAQSFVQQIPGYFLTDHRIGSALIHMWGKVGSVDKAKRIFDKISQPDHIGWTAMINSYGLNGMGDEAVKLFHQMPKESIDHLTYICVLNACSHSGLVDVARSIFNNIQTKTEIIYTTMIDCLSRAAAFEEAQKLIGEFERDHAPAVSVYMPLLSGARNQKYSKLSQEVVDRMQKLFPNMKDSLVAASILLANVYASSGDIGKATDIKIELHKSGAKKRIGVTVTDIDGKLWKFRAHDRSHAESAEIHEQVDRMSKRIIEHGHKYDASWIVRPMEPDETIETLLCGHSERLAMAAHFIRNRKPKRIQMTKNLRICGDCHEVTKLVALIYQCEIVVRDANRIHHFHLNGQCSCQDYF